MPATTSNAGNAGNDAGNAETGGSDGETSPSEASPPGGLTRPLVLALISSTVTIVALGYLQNLPCRAGAWATLAGSTERACYTDLYPLFFVEKLDQGLVPYLDSPVEYPVVLGGVMQVVAMIARGLVGGTGVEATVAKGTAFYDVTAVLLALCAIAAVLATAYTAGRHRARDGLLVAVAPGLLLAAYINWDLVAVALVALALAAWSRHRYIAAGVLLGLAVATKFYPLILLGPLFLLCLRTGQLVLFGRTLIAVAVTWLAVNLPIMVVAPEGWSEFYTFSRERDADWGSVWYLFQQEQVPVVGTSELSTVNMFGTVTFLALCLGIAVLALCAPRRPRLPQLLFLVLAAFLLTNKVWSPQFVLWLLPLVVLARPRRPAFWVWQLAEVGYYFGIWFYLLGLEAETAPVSGGYFPALLNVFGVGSYDQGIGGDAYFTTLLGRLLAVCLLMALVVVDVLRPERDVVRAGGADDPAGGWLDRAPDRFVLRRGQWPVPARRRATAAGHD